MHTEGHPYLPKGPNHPISKCIPWRLELRPFLPLRYKDERLQRRKVGHCYSLFQQILPLQAQSLTISEVAQKLSQQRKESSITLKNFENQERWMWDTIPLSSSKIGFPNSAQSSKSHISGFPSADTVEGSSVHFHAASHSHSHNCSNSPSCTYPTADHIQPDSKEVKLLCNMYTSGKKCPTIYPMPLNRNWSDLEKEDWNSNRQKEKELKELELKTITLQTPKPTIPAHVYNHYQWNSTCSKTYQYSGANNRRETERRRWHGKQFWKWFWDRLQFGLYIR